MKHMKFSEAMLLGLPEINFIPTTWLSDTRNAPHGGGKCTGCLVGAALYAVGHFRLQELLNIVLERHWPWMKDFPTKFTCPFCARGCIWFGAEDSGYLRVGALATHFAHHYQCKDATAEQIADVFRKMEPHDVDEKEQEHETEKHAVQRSNPVGVAGD